MSSQWWSNKIAGHPRPSTPPVGPPVPNYPVTAPVGRPASVPIRYDSASDAVTRAQSQALDSTCPECRSPNYMAASRETRPRCFDCGYPVVQSGSGLSGSASDGPTRKSRQVSTKNNFNPTQIVGRIE